MRLPTNFYVELTTRCQLECLYCSRLPLVRNGIRTVGDMSWEMVEKCVEQCAMIARQVPLVRWCPAGMGDPFLYPHLFEVIALMRAEIPNLHARINTNCLALDDETIEKILESGLDQFTASLNFWETEDYGFVQGRDAFESVRDNIERLLKRRRGDTPKITIQLLDVPMNQPHWQSFQEHWERFGVDEILFRSFIPMPFLSRSALLSDRRRVYNERFGPEDEKLEAKREPCQDLVNTVCVNKDGYIFPCCFGLRLLPESDICLGNIAERTLLDSYLREIKRLRLLHCWGKWDLIKACHDCTYWAVA